MIPSLLWYLTLALLGLLTFPLAYRLFPALADRGYALSRTLGLLLWGFVFWLSVSLGLAQNNAGGLLFALAVVAALSIWALWKAVDGQQTGDKPMAFGLSSVIQWLKTNLRYVLTVEVIFLVAFAGLAFIRANNPETIGTEKPMEIAFINAVLHSPTFPPHDPWLSGYGISYYYFGYVLAGMLAKFTATSGGVAFNLMLVVVFSLSAIGAYGLLYNLLNAFWAKNGARVQNSLRALAGAFFAPLFLLILGNWEGFLEILHRRGIGWTFNADGTATSSFWTWLKMKDLSDAPTLPLGWAPERFWWWWRASRVVHDYDLQGQWLEIIDEFPAFSYLLGDLHPHVLAMPFGLLAMALALNLYLGGFRGVTNLFGLKLPVRREGFILLAVVLGGLAFLNTWDFPVYLAVVCGALVLAWVQERGWNWEILEDFLKFSIPLAVLSIVLYLPFYLSFASQAGGLLPNIIFPTRGAYLWIMFGGLFVPLFTLLFFLYGKQAANWKLGLYLTLGLTGLLWLLSTSLGFVASLTDFGQAFISSQGYVSVWDVLGAATVRRFVFGGGWLTLALLIGGALAYLAALKAQGGAETALSTAGESSDDEFETGLADNAPAEAESQSTATQAPAAENGTGESAPGRSPLPLILMFILFGGLLVLAPDFVYLRDQFGWRINTVFKFYYQAWALWSLAAAFAVAVLLAELRGYLGALYTALVIVVVGVGLVYPVLGFPEKTGNFDPAGGRTLDGAAHLAQSWPDDYAAIQFMTTAAPGIVAEAVGGSYSEFARVATYSGQPTVLGWPGHESQWRGGYTEMGSRDQDLRTLYSTPNWEQAQAILQQYDIRYVYIGPLERRAYTVSEDKFAQHMTEVLRLSSVVIYARTP